MNDFHRHEPVPPPPGLDEDTVSRFGLSIVLDLNGLSQLWAYLRHSSKYQQLMRMLGLPERRSNLRSRGGFESLLRDRQAQLGPWDGRFGPILDRSLDALTQLIGLSPLERALLGLSTLLNAHACFAKLASQSLGELDVLSMVRHMARLLGQPEALLHTVLSADALLVRSGLIMVDRKQRQRLSDKVKLLDGLADALCTGPEAVQTLIARLIPPAPAPALTLADYPHCRAPLDLARRLLAASLAADRVGVNLLIHGPPGTGKTELARALAAAIGVGLYMVPNADEQGDPIGGMKRLHGYRLAQHVLARQDRAVLLFDEVEDVFVDPESVRLGHSESTKGWMTTMLEGNPLPAVWVCNAIDAFDPAYLRRFDQIIALDVPPQPVRARMIEARTRSLALSRAWKARVARHPHLSPALLDRAVEAVARAGYRGRARREAALEMQLNATLKAMGFDPLPKPALEVLPYRPECLNTDHDLMALERGLSRDPHGRLCLYGPPGTGKSAFGSHLAARLNRPLVVRRASNILGSFVGETERRLAAMFREAETEQAVLMLDEADSFLRDRQMTTMSWEVTQVNELLTQLEDFDGVFIASTNLMSSVDTAALRRFDVKIKFDYLLPRQAWPLFEETLRQSGGRLTQRDDWQRRLGSLQGLTPGTFATVVRRQRLLDIPLTPRGLFEALEIESEMTNRTRTRPIGFTAELESTAISEP